MDTSIIVVIALGVVFVVAVPTMLRRSAAEFSRVEVDTIPDEASVVIAEPPPCDDGPSSTRVFRPDMKAAPVVPRPSRTPVASRPEISLSAPSPELSLIRGQAESNRTEGDQAENNAKTLAEAAVSEASPLLPIAVGQAMPLTGVGNSGRGHSMFGHEQARPIGEISAQLGDFAVPAGTNAVAARGNVRPLHPAVRAVFEAGEAGRSSGGTCSGKPGEAHGERPPQDIGPGSSGSHGGGRRSSVWQDGRSIASVGSARPDSAAHDSGPQGVDSRSGDRGAVSEISAPRPIRPAPAPPRDPSPRSTARPSPSEPAEERSMTENAQQEALASLGSMIRGFAFMFLGSVLGVLVTTVLSLFSLAHPALIGVFAGLAVVSLFLVRTLNLRKRDIKRERRSATGGRTANAAGGSAAATTPRSSTTTPSSSDRPAGAAGRPSSAARDTASAGSARASSVITAPPTAPAARRGTQPTTERASASAPVSTGVPHSSPGAPTSAKEARARAAMNRWTSAKQAREEAVTGEIPVVHIRNEAAEGHTTRQVLLTGPIPVIEESTPAHAEAAPTAQTDPAAEVAGASTVVESRTVGTVRIPSNNDRAVEVAEESTERSGTGVANSAWTTSAAGPDFMPKGHIAADIDAADNSVDGSSGEIAVDAGEPVDDDPTLTETVVEDPFVQRLKMRDGWSPTPLPVPSYVGSTEVAHEVPQDVEADAASYEIEARSREDIAAEFAAELGYRPELSDSARADGPLGHGRTAIRTTKTPEPHGLDEVLARRRA